MPHCGFWELLSQQKNLGMFVLRALHDTLQRRMKPMKKSKRMMRKFLLTLSSALLLVSLTVGATVAYLTDTDLVVNTFTVGNVQITLDETDVKPDGTKDTDERVKANEYHLLPGQTYIKDPTVTVLANSEETYVRLKVKVVNLASLKAAIPADKNPTFYNGELFLLQMLANGWDSATWVYEGFANDTYEFRYNGKVAKSATDTKLDALFESITVPGTVDNDHLALLENVQINVTAEAIQAVGFDTDDAAWTAFNGQHATSNN